MCRGDYQFHIVDGLFLLHRHIAVITRATLHRLQHVLIRNNLLYARFTRLLDSKYPDEQRKGAILLILILKENFFFSEYCNVLIQSIVSNVNFLR
jgi:hypothetical protein